MSHLIDLSFTVFSDIHHHHWTTGVTLEDTLSVERAVTNSAIKEDSDFMLFCGDRFESRNPHDEIKARADELMKERNRLFNKPVFLLVGNHDKWWRRPDSGDTYSHLQVFGDSLENVVLMDEPGTYGHVKVEDVLIHALPADQEFKMENYTVDPEKVNIFVFHDLLVGTTVDVGGHKVSTGLSPSLIDLPCFDVVFGGDAHIPQKIPFKRTRGGYIGSTLQFTRRDRGSDRGWIQALVHKEGKVVELKTEFCLSDSPCFVDCELDSALEVSEALPFVVARVKEGYDSILAGNIVTVFMKGSRQSVDQIVTDKWEKEFVGKSGARKVSLFKVVDSVLPLSIKDFESVDNSPEKDLSLYINSGMANLEGLDPEKLKEFSSEVFRDVR